MDPKIILDKYELLIKEMSKSQNKIANSLDKATLLFEKERMKYEEYNRKNWFVKHKTFLSFISPFVLVFLIMLLAYLFVSTGHVVAFKVGNFEIHAQ